MAPARVTAAYASSPRCNAMPIFRRSGIELHGRLASLRNVACAETFSLYWNSKTGKEHPNETYDRYSGDLDVSRGSGRVVRAEQPFAEQSVGPRRQSDRPVADRSGSRRRDRQHQGYA